MTFKEFIEAHGVAIATCVHTGHEDTKGSFGTVRSYQYSLSLSFGPPPRLKAALHKVPRYGTGEGTVERWARETDARVRSPSWGLDIKRGSQLKGISVRTLAGCAYLDEVAKQYIPDVESVLYCLASDASSVQNAAGFEEWAGDLGYDTDSRKAEKVYQGCVEEALALQRWLGLERYSQLIECTED